MTDVFNVATTGKLRIIHAHEEETLKVRRKESIMNVSQIIIPLISSLVGAAMSYTAIRKDIQEHEKRVTVLEIRRSTDEKKMYDLARELAVVKVEMKFIREQQQKRSNK